MKNKLILVAVMQLLAYTSVEGMQGVKEGVEGKERENNVSDN